MTIDRALSHIVLRQKLDEQVFQFLGEDTAEKSHKVHIQV